MFKCVAVLSVATLPLAAQTVSPRRPANSQSQARKTSPSKAARTAAPPAQPTAIAPITPEQLPPSPPRVSYRNNVLTVDSENSTLGAILSAIRQQTGVQIDQPPTGANERVAAHLAGTPRQVLSSLLSGSGLGYAIVGVPNDPERVQKVILTVQSRTPAEAGGFGGGPAYQPAPSTAGNPSEDLSPADDGPTPEQMNERFPGGRQDQPEGPPTQGPPDQPPSSQPQSGQQPQVRTPEQLLQDLRRMRGEGTR